jgi:hypothetical protein
LRHHRAPADKREAAAKEVAAARESLEKALQQIEQPSEQYAKFAGAQWSATRFSRRAKTIRPFRFRR